MVGLRSALILGIVAVVAIVVIAALPLASYGDYKEKDSEVQCHFEAFVGQATGEKGSYQGTYTVIDYADASYFRYWSLYWSGVIDFGAVTIPYPCVSLVLYEAAAKPDGGYTTVGPFPGVEKYQYFPYEVGQQWSTDVLVPAGSGDVIRWQIQIYLAPQTSVGYLGGYWTVP